MTRKFIYAHYVRAGYLKELLEIPDPPEIAKLRGHKITAPVKEKLPLERFQDWCTEYLQRRKLEIEGDL